MVDLFLNAANALSDGSDTPDDNFNIAFMICFSKGVEGLTGDRTPYCSPAGTRPISIVDASNRILASIFQITLEKQVGHRLLSAQRAFLAGRKMMQNILDIDWAAHQVSLKSRSGAILLFDFSAAFPSLSHDMLWNVMDILGIDSSFIEVVKLFYNGSKHFIKVNGMIFDGVTVHSGVRQGCPLSGLLFAICVDTLLRSISSNLGPLEILGAFADDIGLVVLDFWKSSPILQRVFDEFS